jgi:hypothetical protein
MVNLHSRALHNAHAHEATIASYHFCMLCMRIHRPSSHTKRRKTKRRKTKRRMTKCRMTKRRMTKRRMTKRRQDKTSTHQNVDYNKTSTTTIRRKVTDRTISFKKKSSYNLEECTYKISLFLG